MYGENRSQTSLWCKSKKKKKANHNGASNYIQ